MELPVAHDTSDRRHSRLFFTDNENIHLCGDENISNISYTKESMLCANRSDIFIKGCSDVYLKVSDANVAFQNSKVVKVNGQENSLLGHNVSGLLVDGSSWTVTARGTQQLIGSGLNGHCHLMEDLDLRLYGNDNQIVGQRNQNVVICGSANQIIACYNSNLKVRGHSSEVVAAGTENVCIDGSFNQVSIRDTSNHELRKILESSDEPTNLVHFCGIRLQGSSNQYAMKNAIPGGEERNISPLSRIMALGQINAVLIVPQVKIQYLDHSVINGNHYNLGIFSFQIDDLSSGSETVKLKLLPDNVDGNSIRWSLSGDAKCLTVIATKDGIRQSLRFSGFSIREELNGSHDSFIVVVDLTRGA